MPRRGVVMRSAPEMDQLIVQSLAVIRNCQRGLVREVSVWTKAERVKNGGTRLLMSSGSRRGWLVLVGGWWWRSREKRPVEDERNRLSGGR